MGAWKMAIPTPLVSSDCDRDGDYQTEQPTQQADKDTFNHHHAVDITVICADGAHHAYLTGSFEHIDAHGSHQTDPANNCDQHCHQHHEVD